MKNCDLVVWFTLSFAGVFVLSTRAEEAGGAAPAAALLAAGDLIWPKKPGVIVPYDSRPGQAENSDAARWQKEKEAYLDQLRKRPGLPLRRRNATMPCKR
jgi:hypothetical protein